MADPRRLVIAKLAGIGLDAGGISEAAFRDLMAYHAKVCPIGPDRLDRPLATFMAAALRYLAIAAGEEPYVIQSITPVKFMPWLELPVDPQEERKREEMEAKAREANARSQQYAARMSK